MRASAWHWVYSQTQKTPSGTRFLWQSLGRGPLTADLHLHWSFPLWDTYERGSSTGSRIASDDSDCSLTQDSKIVLGKIQTLASWKSEWYDTALLWMSYLREAAIIVIPVLVLTHFITGTCLHLLLQECRVQLHQFKALELTQAYSVCYFTN